MNKRISKNYKNNQLQLYAYAVGITHREVRNNFCTYNLICFYIYITIIIVLKLSNKICFPLIVLMDSSNFVFHRKSPLCTV